MNWRLFFLYPQQIEKSVPQDSRARICIGTRAASSEYQIQIFPLSRRRGDEVSGRTRIALKVPAGVLICSRASAWTMIVTVAPPSLMGKLYVFPGSKWQRSHVING